MHPVRGQLCSHTRCFDLDSFLEAQLSATSANWRCPVCNTSFTKSDDDIAPWRRLVLDEFVLEMLASAPPSCTR